ncbi:terminase small subunit [Salmonella enterica]|nr:terminase small subunit [Salmonella enterica]EBS9961428.1 terminase small subunit [Salmonella enterica]
MNVNKKKLAEIFGCDVRTVTAWQSLAKPGKAWQSQGLPLVSGGGKGNEAVFDTAAAISWYAERDASIENEKLRKEVDDLRAAAESDLNPGTIDYERYRLTKAQADAQELKNAEREGLVLETELFTYILQRVAQEIAGILSRIPLVLQRKYPDLCQSHIDVVRTEIARASGRAATIADVEKWTDDFRRAQGE